MELIALLLVVVVVIWLQNLIFRKFSFRRLDYRCYLSQEEASEGDEVQLVEEIVNRKWLPVPWFKSEITTSCYLDFAGAQSSVTDKTRFVPSFFSVKSYRRVQRSWKVRCLRRGEYAVQKVVLVSSDLLGNSLLSQPAQADSRILVLPKPLELETQFCSPQYYSGDVVVRRRLLEDPFWLAGVQEYTGREAMNRIHWAATAKEQKIMVHHQECTSSQSVSVILNVQSRPFENSEAIDEDYVEDAIRTCAAVFQQTLQEQLPLRFFANASLTQEREDIATGEYWGEEYVLELFRLLARLKLKSTQNFPDYLNELYDRVEATDFVVVTPYLCEEILDFARQKTQAGSHVKIFVTGKAERSQLAEDCEVFCLASRFQEEEGGMEHAV